MKIMVLLLLVFSVFSFSREVIDKNGNCQINWTGGYILCEGESAEGQSKYAADLSAKVISQRNMLEVIKGVNITSEMTIKNGLDSSEIIKSRVDGVIKGAQIVSKKYNPQTQSSIVITKLELGKDLLEALLSDTTLLSWNEKIEKMWNSFDFISKANASTYTLSEKQTILKLLNDLNANSEAKNHLEEIIKKLDDVSSYTGVLLDISEISSFKKALIVKLVDEDGKEFYPSDLVSTETLTKKNTSVGYMLGKEDARKNQRIFSNPIELKSISTYKNKSSDIVLSKEQIAQLKSLDKNVLSNAKIMLVLGE